MRNIQSFEKFQKPKIAAGAIDLENIANKIEPAALAPSAPAPASASSPDPNEYKNKLIKLIPSEVIASFIFIERVIKSSSLDSNTINIIQWVVFAILLVINPLYLNKAMDVTNKKQIIVTTIAFPIWVFALGGPFESFSNQALMHLSGSILMALYTLAIPMVVKPEIKSNPI